MKKIKLFTTVLYVMTAAELLGAWNNAPQVKETAAFQEVNLSLEAEEENLLAAQEIQAKIKYANRMACETEKSHENQVIENQADKEEWERLMAEMKKEKEKRKKKKREERAILERIVEAEAGDQDVKGRVLVANVILNRVKSKRFPNTVKGVVFAHRQFSPIRNGSYYRVSVSNKTKEAVRLALKGTDYSCGALYFMCRSASAPSNVAWFDCALTKVKEYGCHEFFK